MIVYSKIKTDRFEYIVDLVLGQIIGLDFTITDDIEEFENSNSSKLNYSTHSFNDSINIPPYGILSEDYIIDQDITVNDWIYKDNKTKIFFERANGSLPFDIFSTAFYLVTRYEEYLPSDRDFHDRYDASESLAFKNGFIDSPIVNVWCENLKDIISSRNKGLTFSERKFKFIPTIDIDNPYAYKHKGFFRTLGATINDFSSVKLLKKRLSVMINKVEDPYFTFDVIFDIHNKAKLSPIFFFQVGKYGKYDKNPSLKSHHYSSLIKNISESYEVNLHPSYNSNNNIKRLIQEKKNLEEVIGKEVCKSRQHYIKLKFPDTYMNLIEAGIKEDFSMSYPQIPGFRAGICTPFKFFNLKTNKTTDLVIRPLIIMETTFKTYVDADKKRIFNIIKTLYHAVKEVNGEFICLWHNESFNNDNFNINYLDIYKSIIEYIHRK